MARCPTDAKMTVYPDSNDLTAEITRRSARVRQFPTIVERQLWRETISIPASQHQIARFHLALVLSALTINSGLLV
jgi:hypothetical protein